MEDFYCYRCNFVFDPVTEAFSENVISYDRLVAGAREVSLRLFVRPSTNDPSLPFRGEVVLENTGTDPVDVGGRTAFLLEYAVGDEQYVTLLGNPHRHTPEDRVWIDPDQRITWPILLRIKGLRVDEWERWKRMLPGVYRFIYWGLPENDQIIATTFEIHGADRQSSDVKVQGNYQI